MTVYTMDELYHQMQRIADTVRREGRERGEREGSERGGRERGGEREGKGRRWRGMDKAPERGRS